MTAHCPGLGVHTALPCLPGTQVATTILGENVPYAGLVMWRTEAMGLWDPVRLWSSPRLAVWCSGRMRHAAWVEGSVSPSPVYADDRCSLGRPGNDAGRGFPA